MQSSEEMAGELEGRPYDFELSSNSKYKIISDNERIKGILLSEIQKPHFAEKGLAGKSICKKISFGKEEQTYKPSAPISKYGVKEGLQSARPVSHQRST
mmetsp:Transcript_23669/g.18102  ORF Transcript_23669/g.18102 Transcript_23669/m.18102 type:complete len:99 (+) Transcript_23669:150-446(+)